MTTLLTSTPPHRTAPVTPSFGHQTFTPSTFDPSSLSKKYLNTIKKLYDLSLKQPLEVAHLNNYKSKIFFIGKYRTFESYRRHAQKNIVNLIKYIAYDADTTNNDTDESWGATYVLRSIAEYFPTSFRQSAVAKVVPQLNTIQSSALIEYCNLTDSTAYDRMNKFFIRVFGVAILSPKRDIRILNTNTPTPLFGILPVVNKEDIEKKELMVPWVSSQIGDCVQKEIERHLTLNAETKSTKFFDMPMKGSSGYTFGYPTCSGDNRVYCVVSSDHGKKHSQFDFSLLLAPSTARRHRKNTDFGIINAPFFTAECPTDNINVTKLGADQINEAIELLEKCQLIGIHNNDGMYTTEFIPSNAKDIKVTENKLTFRLDNDPNTQYVELNDAMNKGLGYSIEYLFQGATILVVADYKESFTLQGRDGMSTSKCLHCTATSSNWKPGDVRCEWTNITLDMLNTCSKVIGCKTKPLINLPPERYITPLLHLLLGLINDIWKKGILPTAIDLDGGSTEEVELRTTKMDDVCENIRLMRESIAPIQKKLSGQKNRLTYWEKKNPSTLTQKQHDLIKEHRTTNKIIKPMKETLQKHVKELRNIKIKIEKIVEKRTNNINSIDTEIKNELTSRGIFLEVMHGGTLTGNNCKRLCEKAKEFVKSASEICIRKYEENKTNGNIPANHPDSVAELKSVFKQYEDALLIADITFSNLNIVAPTNAEMKETEESVRRLGMVWKKVSGVTHTTKVHSLMEHACDCQRRFGGIGDKTEQGIEKRHQIQKQMCNRLIRFGGNFEDRMKKQLEYEWRQRHPAVEQLIFSIHKSVRKRKCSELTLAEENAAKRIAGLEQERKVFMRRLCSELDAEVADVKEDEQTEIELTENGIASREKERE